MALDKETKELLSYQERISELIQSDHWSMLREVLVNKMMDLQSVLNIDPTSDLAVQVQARALAVTYLKDFIAEIEGIANQYKAHSPLMNDHVRIQEKD